MSGNEALLVLVVLVSLTAVLAAPPASANEPARVLAVFVADDGATLIIPDPD
jgi:hypothetical protein